MPERRSVSIQGIVQGVGFRPFVYHLAGRLGLRGRVWNVRRGAMVEVEGTSENLNRFCRQLVEDAPAGAFIERVQADPMPVKGDDGFSIAPSDRLTSGRGLIPGDLATCSECLAELDAPSDRRYGYAFLNCTRCGPRFTIMLETPYDRVATTMAGFPMCPACRAEYVNPDDRRFHAQPIACPACGPRLSVLDGTAAPCASEDPLGAVVSALQAGRLVAVKSLGGYHLACDASNESAVEDLRRRKRRNGKGLALMVPDVDAAREYCHIDAREHEALVSAQRPVVLLTRRRADVPAGVAPGAPCLGVMLPYTPLHHLLLKRFGGPLVMTSGNRSRRPMAYRDEDVRGELAGIADLFLVHDRPIHRPCDDSVVRVMLGRPVPFRRARGYVPLPIKLKHRVACPVLACGGHLKNVFCLAEGDHAVLSGHNGDLESAEAVRAFETSIARFQELVGIRPAAVAHDLHPEYASTRYARSLSGLPRIAVQHHHAHIAACLAENGVGGPVIGVAFDGMGYGTDGTLWGGEFLIADYGTFTRAAHLGVFPLPGGERAVHEPWRIAAGLLEQIYGERMETLDVPFTRRLAWKQWEVLRRAVSARLNSPLTSSAGRLCDAVSALLGVCPTATYEAEAAIRLESLAGSDPAAAYPHHLEHSGAGRPLVVRVEDVIRGVIDDLRLGRGVQMIASRFHSTLADVIRSTCRRLRAEHGLSRIALSGGVFQNARLLAETVALLSTEGFRVYWHNQVPPNDGGIALGQAAVAGARIEGRQAEA